MADKNQQFDDVLKGIPFLDAQAKIYEKYLGKQENGTRFEIYASAQRVDKFMLSFQELKNRKQTALIRVFLPAGQTIELFHRLSLGIMKPIDAEHNKLWTAPPMGSPGKNGNPAEYRWLEIFKGNKYAYLMQARRCDAFVRDNGLINFKKDMPNLKKTTMGFSIVDCQTIYYKLLQAYIGYGAAQWTAGALLGNDLVKRVLHLAVEEYLADYGAAKTAANTPIIDKETGEVIGESDPDYDELEALTADELDVPANAEEPSDPVLDEDGAPAEDINIDDLPF